MAKRPWLEEVERQLAASKLPAEYIRRFMDELADHYEDLTEETMSKEASVLSRLGEPGQVAEAAIAAHAQQTFFGRHPSAAFWVFGVSPMAAMLAGFVLACLGVVAVGEMCDQCGLRLTGKEGLGRVAPAALGWGLSLVTTIVPAALLTFLYGGFARRLEISRKWTVAPCCVLALIAMLPLQSITLSDTPGKSLWSIGLGFPPGLLQCVQLLVPLAVGLWFTRRPDRRGVHEECPGVSSSNLAA